MKYYLCVEKDEAHEFIAIQPHDDHNRCITINMHSWCRCIKTVKDLPKRLAQYCKTKVRKSSRGFEVQDLHALDEDFKEDDIVSGQGSLNLLIKNYRAQEIASEAEKSIIDGGINLMELL